MYCETMQQQIWLKAYNKRRLYAVEEDLKPFLRNARIIPTYPDGVACQNGIALIGQLKAAKRFYIFTDLTCIHDLTKC